MGRTPLAVAALASIVLSACAPKLMPAPVVTVPRFPDFMRPAVPPALAGSPAAINHDRAWAFLQAGDLRAAEREVATVLAAVPAFYPAEATAGYIEFARKDAVAAVTRFDRALTRQPDYLPALVGRGHALVAEGRDADAIATFETALATDPSLADIRRLVEVLRFRSVERSVAGARQAARAGQAADARRAYGEAIASSPDSAFLYRELAGVERQQGDTAAAIAHLRKAVALEPGDTTSLAQIGEILEKEGDIQGALDTYELVLGLEASEQIEARRDAIRARLDLAKLPEEYRAIESAPQVSRGDLAALLGVRVGPVLQTLRSADAAVITDVRAHWAEPWIMSVARAGVMEPFANHTFQPRTLVRRADLAQAVMRLLLRAAPAAQARTWQAARAKFTDIAAGHLAYPAASFAASAGVMAPESDGSFQPSRLVTGAEASAAAEQLASMLGARAQGSNRR